MIETTTDGWFIEQNGRFYHLNAKWLEEMFRHQVKPYGNNPAFNRLYAAFHTGADPEDIETRLEEFLEAKAGRPSKGKPDPTEFQQFIRRQRGIRRNQSQPETRRSDPS